MSQSAYPNDQAVGLRESLARVGHLLGAWRGPGRRQLAAVGQTPYQVIHRENKMSVLRYDTGSPVTQALPIVLVPSLINRHYIFDLMPGKSIVEHLSRQGFVVTTIDWGSPGEEDRLLRFDQYIDTYLRRAVRVSAGQTGAKQVILVGYCLGGTMATIYNALHPDSVHSLIALTSPVDFTDNGLLTTWAQAPNFDVETMVQAFGNVPWALLQSSFQMLRPTLALSKAKGLLQRIWDDNFVDGVVALETWGNDNVSFPGACYRTFIQDLYRGNALVRGNLQINGKPVQLGQIRNPVLNIQASYDTIVPASSSSPLGDLVGSKQVTTWTVPGGHIGAVVSNKAMQTLWPSVLGWLQATQARGQL